MEEPAAPPVAPLGEPRTTRYAGAFLLYAALARVDLWGVFRQLAATTGPARWHGWAHTVAAIVCGFGLRFRSIEDLKNALRADLGVLLGTAQAPTVLVCARRSRPWPRVWIRWPSRGRCFAATWRSSRSGKGSTTWTATSARTTASTRRRRAGTRTAGSPSRSHGCLPPRCARARAVFRLAAAQ